MHREIHNPITWVSPISPEEREGVLAGTCWLGTNRSDSHSSKYQSQHRKPVGWTDKKKIKQQNRGFVNRPKAHQPKGLKLLLLKEEETDGASAAQMYFSSHGS